ncbi:ClpP family protease [Streptomyces niveus]|uniref:ClpP family protease n=1 Tax=Streptomyces niveus TaxID=193462 RepID=UPI0034437D25
MLSTVPRRAVTARAETAPVPFDDQIAGRLQHGRIVVLGEQVDDGIANRICAQLLLLSQEDPKSDIVLIVNSPGGSVLAGMAVYDTMRFIPNDVATLAMGFAASMGQFLLCAGAPGKRYALPNARIMMHQPSGGIGGTAADIAVQAENMAYTKLTMQKLIAEHCGQSLETVAADQRRDRWFTAEQAREYGFVDRVVHSAAELGGDAAGGFGFGFGSGSGASGKEAAA